MKINFSELNKPGWYEQHRQQQGDWDDEVLAISPRLVDAVKEAPAVLPSVPVENEPFVPQEGHSLGPVAIGGLEVVTEEVEVVQKIHSS